MKKKNIVERSKISENVINETNTVEKVFAKRLDWSFFSNGELSCSDVNEFNALILSRDLCKYTKYM